MSLSINPAMERLFGYDLDELIGKNVAMLMPEPDRSPMMLTTASIGTRANGE